MKSILRARVICSTLMVLLPLCAILAYGIWRSNPSDPYSVYDVHTYSSPDDSHALKVQRWEDQNGDLGWDFYLVAADGEEQLLKRTHALSGAAITDVQWADNGVDVSTRAPSGGFALTWN